MKIQKNDKVKILLGKDSGKTGKVQRVLTKEDKVVVEGLNVYKRHIKKRGNKEGGIIELAKPMDISNVALVCPNCDKSTRIGYEIKDGTKVRICKKCHKLIGKGAK